jgi:hypothetical protein
MGGGGARRGWVTAEHPSAQPLRRSWRSARRSPRAGEGLLPRAADTPRARA